MTQYRILDAERHVVQTADLESNEKAYDWFKNQSKAGDYLGWGLEANVDGEWQLLDQSDGGIKPTGSTN